MSDTLASLRRKISGAGDSEIGGPLDEGPGGLEHRTI